MPRGTVGRLAEGAAKGTGDVCETVFPTRVASSKHVSPLATVCSLGLSRFPPFSRVAFLWWPPLLKWCTAYVAFRDAGSRVMTAGFAFPVVDLPARMRARSAGALAKVAHVWRPEMACGDATDDTSQRLPHAFLVSDYTQNALCVGMPCPWFSLLCPGLHVPAVLFILQHKQVTQCRHEQKQKRHVRCNCPVLIHAR